MSTILIHSRQNGSTGHSLDILWRDYLSAREAAERTRDIRCGIAAGRAWRNWPSAFAAASGADDLTTVVPHGNG